VSIGCLGVKDSRWTGTFSVDIELSGNATGSASISGDLNFVVQNPQMAGTPGPEPVVPVPPFVNAVTGSFRLNFTSYAKLNNKSFADGEFIGSGPQTGTGAAVGNLDGYYLPSTNTVKITFWGPIITSANGVYTTGQGMPDEQTTHYTVSNQATPMPGNTPPAPPPAYMPPPGAPDDAPTCPGVFLPCVGPGSSIQLDLNNSGTQSASNSQEFGDESNSFTATATWSFNLKAPTYTIEISPIADLDPTGDATTSVTITVYENGQLSQNRDVDITVCTEFGGLGDNTDGHGQHDPSVGDPCDPRGRPTGSINNQSDYPVTVTTDATGTVKVTYESPLDPNTSSCYISGTDDVKAVVDDPTIADKTPLTDQQSVKTWVQDLQPMPPDALYYFGPQSQHPGEFYGTTDTIDAIQGIASAFNAAQIACQNGDNPNYQNSQGQNLNTPPPVKLLCISAMSLPWGGLNDIGHAPYGTVWNPPHYSHNSGKVADFPLGDMTQQSDSVSAWDQDRIVLLWNVITKECPNFAGWGRLQTEGANLNATLQTPGTHFHVNFKT